MNEAYFSPGEECLNAICSLLNGAQSSVDICVFTITDNRITKQILAAHRRGVSVRVLTDNDKAYDRGSDIERLVEAGLPVRVDKTDDHMHHKFSVFDGRSLLTGSYNWTRSAAERNQENILVTEVESLVESFAKEFARLWTRSVESYF